jgi:hypothetical protein
LGKPETQGPVGRSLEDSTVIIAGIEVISAQILTVFPKIWMDLLIDMNLVRWSFFLLSLPDRSITSLIYYFPFFIFFFFSFIPKSKMKAFWKVFFYFIGRWIIMTHVLRIGDKHVKDVVHWQNNPKSTPKYEAENI